ncbi:MAG: ABC transporter ATP-binding protein [Acidimicrobiales bacterium]
MTGGMVAETRLEVRGLHAGWDGIPIVRGADFEVRAGEIVAVLGGNGSGKSTLVSCLAGLIRPTAGAVRLAGRRVDGHGAVRLAARGLRLLPQTRRVFPTMTVAENLEVVELGSGKPDLAGISRRREAWLERFPALAAKLDQPAASLSGGEQQLVAIGRVLSTAPVVLLLDEPSAGLSPAAAATCARAFADEAASGTAVVLVEQNLSLARTLAHRALRMEDGQLEPDQAALAAGIASP